MRFKKLFTAALLAAAITAPTMSEAAQVIRKFKLTQTFGPGAPAPVKSVTFQVSFDNSANVLGTSNGLTIFQSDHGPGMQFAYMTSGDILTLANGGNTGPGFCSNPANTYCAFISGISTPNPSAFFGIDLDGDGNPFFAQSSQLVELGVGGVPEPTTWAMMILGFGVVGGAMRRRKAAVRTSVSYA